TQCGGEYMLVLDDYRPIVGSSTIDELHVLGSKFAGRTVRNVNSTATGGGVAEILHRMIPLLRELGVDAKWDVIKGGDSFFWVTKKIHNALHGAEAGLSPEEISRTFMEKGIITEPTTNPIELGKAVRVYLREKFRHLDMGIVGVNMAVAATGTVINVENEGNIRMTKSSPRTLVAVMSPEKVIPTMADAVHMIRILCRNCTGQKISSYVSMDTGPKKTAEIDGPEELFIVVVDNGRSEIYRDPLTRQVLRCIRCGGCLNTCPVYAKIGGYPYGFTYSGPMGQVMNPLLLGLDKTADLYRACTLCGACRQICPAGVDHPSLMLAYRERQVASRVRDDKRMSAFIERIGAGLVSLGMSSAAAWNLAARSMKPVMKRLENNGYIRNIPFGLKGWFACRDLPGMPEKTFHEWWKAKGRKG
ncbi:MAG TPA: LUD domain-containing protein, partial [Deltaproteobacteria bacterium]|nr:LUD domain-containing protein [Deltaproteobacteria bacterium]